ncbi:uncharacterized protein znf518b [Genypterus blacodes]|uniref:uncharacterized protein znf518b n=1 Tax=Genypterus blacodes TaxID=154954 RepID=UPI003F775727
MKPVSYQHMASTVNGGHPNLGLDRLSTSQVTYCEVCGFASKDPEVFKKHMMEHMGTRFYCFYCNNVSFSEAELNAHLKQHTTKYPFRCQHCGQGYMRRLCLVKHIERFHSKINGQALATPAITKSIHLPVTSAFPSVPGANQSSVRPTVKVTIPNPITPAARLGKEQHRGKVVDVNAPNVRKGDADVTSPVNGHIQYNRALTVSLPEEVTIPAGCMVELIEVRTVNGTKELKLRLVSQQENESALRDTRTGASQNTTPGKPLFSTLNNPNTKPTNMGVCTINRKQCETKTLYVEQLAGVPADKFGTKRTSQEMTNLNLERHAIIPPKVSKQIPNPVRVGKCGLQMTQRESVTHNPTSSIPSISNRHFMVEHSKNGPPRRVSEMKSAPQNASMAVKTEPGGISAKNSASASRIRKEAEALNQQSLKSALSSSTSSVQLAAAAQGRSSALYASNDNANANLAYAMSGIARRTLNEPSSANQRLGEGGSSLSNSKTSTWMQDRRSNELTVGGDTPKLEGFPVISSVFSLSQQPEVVQGSMQPLVMALRGIVMNKTNCSNQRDPDGIKVINISIEPKKEKPEVEVVDCAQVAPKDGSFTADQAKKEQTAESVKIEAPDKTSQHSQTNMVLSEPVKEEHPPSDSSKPETQSESSSSATEPEAAPLPVSHRDVSVTAHPLLNVPFIEKKEHDVTSKFLTVSLKRIQVGSWKTTKKRPKFRIDKCKPQEPAGSLTDCVVIYPTPLKVDQLVKQPGPNQPVVVLNHPKPQGPKGGAGAAASIASLGAAEVVPKCQILKMRLSKVMGQKYEVLGCTVGGFP